jgi:hypothetical protein
MNRKPAGTLNSLAIIATEIETSRLDLEPHRQTDAWSIRHKQFYVQLNARCVSI